MIWSQQSKGENENARTLSCSWIYISRGRCWVALKCRFLGFWGFVKYSQNFSHHLMENFKWGEVEGTIEFPFHITWSCSCSNLLPHIVYVVLNQAPHIAASRKAPPSVNEYEFSANYENPPQQMAHVEGASERTPQWISIDHNKAFCRSMWNWNRSNRVESRIY